MKICSVIVWYNPDESCVKNIITYSSIVEKCYIIDNSATDNSALSSKIPNVVYIANMKNLGVAKALNIGCQKALDQGFEWCMTMDQDSKWEETELKNYIEKCKLLSNESKKIVSFAPGILCSDKAVSVLSTLVRKIRNKKKLDEIVYPNRVITSGNVINLSIWFAIGKFYEPLFIDDVDSEYSFRLRKQGYLICMFPNLKMKHELGTPKKMFFPFHDFHSGIRLYYMIRNMLWLIDNYPIYTKSEHYKKMYFTLWFDKLLRFDRESLFYMRKGKKDYKNQIMGEFYNA